MRALRPGTEPLKLPERDELRLPKGRSLLVLFALLLVSAIFIIVLPRYGIVPAIALLGFAPVLVLFSMDLKNIKVLHPDREKVVYFLFTAASPLVYSGLLVSVLFDAEFLATLEPVFVASWLVLLLAMFLLYYLLSCFIPSAVSRRRYRLLTAFAVVYFMLSFVQIFSIEITYFLVSLAT